jgi:hypothetical protein
MPGIAIELFLGQLPLAQAGCFALSTSGGLALALGLGLGVVRETEDCDRVVVRGM